MAIVFDATKDALNVRTRNLSFQRAEDFDFDSALFQIDKRMDYGEVRIRALGFLEGRLHVLVFSERGEDLRIISLRKASRTEMREYAES